MVGYHRDDPELSCGHIKRRTDGDDKVEKCNIDIERALAEEAKLRGVSVEQAKEDLLNSLINETIHHETIDFCDICGTAVTVIIDIHGVRRCGGNLVDNPGCGCLLMPIAKRVIKSKTKTT